MVNVCPLYVVFSHRFEADINRNGLTPPLSISRLYSLEPFRFDKPKALSLGAALVYYNDSPVERVCGIECGPSLDRPLSRKWGRVGGRVKCKIAHNISVGRLLGGGGGG